jgi:hypothetical protein
VVTLIVVLKKNLIIYYQIGRCFHTTENNEKPKAFFLSFFQVNRPKKNHNNNENEFFSLLFHISRLI